MCGRNVSLTLLYTYNYVYVYLGKYYFLFRCFPFYVNIILTDCSKLKCPAHFVRIVYIIRYTSLHSLLSYITIETLCHS